jgi:hypothetical protein
MPMALALNFYRDQVATDGATALPLPPAHRDRVIEV